MEFISDVVMKPQILPSDQKRNTRAIYAIKVVTGKQDIHHVCSTMLQTWSKSGPSLKPLCATFRAITIPSPNTIVDPILRKSLEKAKK